MRRSFVRILPLAFVVLALSCLPALAAPKATIMRDSYGVPHIFANTLDGLYTGFGYAVAQDRLYQIEMFRRTYWGRLSEVYGDSLLAFDQANRRDGFTKKEMQKQISKYLKSYHKKAIKAFAAGINRYIKEALADRANKLPKEFHYFGFDPEEWADVDVAANFLGIMGLFMDASGELQNASMYQYLSEHYGAEQAAALFNDWVWVLDPSSPTTMGETTASSAGKVGTIRNAALRKGVPADPFMKMALKSARNAEAAWIRERVPALRMIAQVYPFGRPTSYAAVIGPQKSATGQVLLMGGPQFYYQLPGTVHEVGLHGAGIDAVGSTLTGYPFIMFGHNKSAAFTTTAGLDNIEDIFAEKLNPSDPTQYWFKGKWKKMSVRKETFQVKGAAEPVTQQFYYTVHGPVFYLDEANHVAFTKQLSCKERFLTGLASMYDLMNAQTVAEFNKAGELNDMTLNQFFAGTSGDIAYFHTGRYPIRAEGVDVRMPTAGTGEYEWAGYLSKSQNPQESNPSKGYFLNWNNQPKPGWGHGDMATTDLWGGWGTDNRVTTMQRLVESKAAVSTSDLKDVIKNIAFYDKRATNIKAQLLEAVAGVADKTPDAEQALQILSNWNNLNVDENKDGFYDDPGSAIYDRWWPKAVAATFGDWYPGFVNPLGQTAVQILSDRYMGYTLFFKALKGTSSVDYFKGQKTQVLYDTLLAALQELAVENPGKTVAEYRRATVMDGFYPITVVGYFNGQPITSSTEQLPYFPYVDRGTENHIVTVGTNGIWGENITPPGNSGFVKADGTRSAHFSDQYDMFVNFTYKDMPSTSEQISSRRASSIQQIE
jgi:penicillin G amidase